MALMHSPFRPQIIPPDLVMLAYRDGIFPMSDGRDNAEVFWVEPKRRAILPLDGFHCSHSLAKRLRQGDYEVTCDTAFAEVLEACAAPRGGRHGNETWINGRLAATYRALYRTGQAHSIEVWQRGADGARVLVGGLYGVGFDRIFCGESMFSQASDASKLALAWLVVALRIGGIELLDCQFMTDHLASLGAIEITQARYLRRLRHAQRPTTPPQLPAGASPASASFAGGAEGAAVAASAGLAPSAVPLPLPVAFTALLVAAEASSSSPGNFIAQSLTQTS